MITETIGWVGAFLLAFCGLPEVIISFKTGSSSLSWYFLSMWGSGEIFALIYTLIKSKQVKLLPLLFNYGLNILCITFICAIKCGMIKL